jgi:hypothetical protein
MDNYFENVLALSQEDMSVVAKYAGFREPQDYERVSPYLAEFLIHLIRRIETLENRVSNE